MSEPTPVAAADGRSGVTSLLAMIARPMRKEAEAQAAPGGRPTPRAPGALEARNLYDFTRDKRAREGRGFPRARPGRGGPVISQRRGPRATAGAREADVPKMVECSGKDILTVVCCVIVPPLGIYLKGESFDCNFWIALVMWLFLFTWPIAALFALAYCASPTLRRRTNQTSRRSVGGDSSPRRTPNKRRHNSQTSIASTAQRIRQIKKKTVARDGAMFCAGVRWGKSS